MKVISHRGWWQEFSQKNTLNAFQRSIDGGFGIETDIRDYKGELVISHDVPCQRPSVTFEKFLEVSATHRNDTKLTLAINVKADGLASRIADSVSRFNNLDYFCFDMSVPDMRDYFDYKIPVFARLSEEEKEPAWLDKCSGVWLDSFLSEWYDLAVIESMLNSDKQVCIVSSELHGRDYRKLWNMLAPIRNHQLLSLCTDLPLHAEEFFNEN